MLFVPASERQSLAEQTNQPRSFAAFVAQPFYDVETRKETRSIPQNDTTNENAITVSCGGWRPPDWQNPSPNFAIVDGNAAMLIPNSRSIKALKDEKYRISVEHTWGCYDIDVPKPEGRVTIQLQTSGRVLSGEIGGDSAAATATEIVAGDHQAHQFQFAIDSVALSQDQAVLLVCTYLGGPGPGGREVRSIKMHMEKQH